MSVYEYVSMRQDIIKEFRVYETKEQLETLQRVCEALYIAREVTLDSQRVKDILNAIGNWQRALGGTEETELEFYSRVDKAFEALRKVVE